MSVNGNGGREAVICEPLRTPVGRFGGVFRDVEAATLASTVIGALIERTGLSGEDVDDVVLGQCSPECRGAGDRARRGARRRPAGRRARCPGRQALRLGAAGGDRRLHAGTDRRGGPDPRRRRREHEPDRVLLDRDALGRAHGGGRSDGPPHARAGHRGRDQPPGPGRDARNRREPAPRVLDPARGAGRALAALPPARRGGAAGRSLRRGDRAGAGQARGSCGARRASREPTRASSRSRGCVR